LFRKRFFESISQAVRVSAFNVSTAGLPAALVDTVMSTATGCE
jgi:hypothetical protein